MHTSNGPLPPLISSQRKIPDLCTYDRKDKTRVLLQIEVDSGDLNKTLRKVALVRIDQLLYERNLDDSISICIGFYFPNNSSSTSVMKVTLMWSDETTNSIVPEENVIREIKTAIQLKKTKLLIATNKRECICTPIVKIFYGTNIQRRQCTMSFQTFNSYRKQQWRKKSL